MGSVLAPGTLGRSVSTTDTEPRTHGRGHQVSPADAQATRAAYSQVWLWRNWPRRWGIDGGIDLTDTFLSESNRRGIDSRLLIASTNRFADSAQEIMADHAGVAGASSAIVAGPSIGRACSLDSRQVRAGLYQAKPLDHHQGRLMGLLWLADHRYEGQQQC
jgi:hypothetical protein